jgi:hypothetical protein
MEGIMKPKIPLFMSIIVLAGIFVLAKAENPTIPPSEDHSKTASISDASQPPGPADCEKLSDAIVNALNDFESDIQSVVAKQDMFCRELDHPRARGPHEPYKQDIRNSLSSLQKNRNQLFRAYFELLQKQASLVKTCRNSPQ